MRTDFLRLIDLQPNERVDLIVRRSGATIVTRLILTGALVVLPFFFLFSLARLGVAGALIVLVLVVAGAIGSIVTLRGWHYDVLILTSSRACRLGVGLWQPRLVAQISASDLGPVSVDGLVVRLATSDAPTRSITINNLSHPEDVRDAIKVWKVQRTSTEDASTVIVTEKASIGVPHFHQTPLAATESHEDETVEAKRARLAALVRSAEPETLEAIENRLTRQSKK